MKTKYGIDYKIWSVVGTYIKVSLSIKMSNNLQLTHHANDMSINRMNGDAIKAIREMYDIVGIKQIFVDKYEMTIFHTGLYSNDHISGQVMDIIFKVFGDKKVKKDCKLDPSVTPKFCYSCRCFMNLDPDSIRNDVWYNHLCKATKSRHAWSRRSFAYCRDVNNMNGGNCSKRKGDLCIDTKLIRAEIYEIERALRNLHKKVIDGSGSPVIVGIDVDRITTRLTALRKDIKKNKV